jgi:hypothetical protein
MQPRRLRHGAPLAAPLHGSAALVPLIAFHSRLAPGGRAAAAAAA